MIETPSPRDADASKNVPLNFVFWVKKVWKKFKLFFLRLPLCQQQSTN